MSTPEERTDWLIAWWNRLAPIVNGRMKARRDLCRDLALAVGEIGEDAPSAHAIEVAQHWETRIMAGEEPWGDQEITVQTAHFGDPCVYCGTPHDEVQPGPCPARKAGEER